MTESIVPLLLDLIQTAAWVTWPILAAVLVAGVAVGFAQAVTSIQDAAISQAIRLVAGGGALLFTGARILSVCTQYMLSLYGDFGRFLQP